MLPRFSIAVLAALLMVSSAANAQQRRVVVSRPDDRALKLTALRLHLCVDQLLKGRQALEAATRLAPEVEGAYGEMGQLAGHWVRLDPENADSELERLAELLRRRAEEATDFGAYQQLSYAALQMAQQLDQTDQGGRVEALLAGWPEPPLPDPRQGQAVASWTENVRRQHLRQRRQQEVYRDPFAMLERLPEAEVEAPDWNLRNQLINNLMNRNEPELAAGLAADTLDLLAGAELQENDLYSLASLTSQMSVLESDEFERAIDLYLEHARRFDFGDPRSVTHNWNGEQVELTRGQNLVANLIRNLGNQPRAVLDVLDAAPDLAAKIEGVGGIDRFLSGRGRVRQKVDEYQRLHMELNHADAETVVRRVGNSRDPREMYVLLQAAQRHCERPDDVEWLLDTALRGVRELEAREAANLLVQMIQTSARCLGEVTPAVEAEARLVIEDLRLEEEQRQMAPIQGRHGYGTSWPGHRQSDQLEVELAVSEAIFEFDSTVERIERLPEPELRLSAWLRVLQSVTSR